jgi:hypothetical protein
LLPYQRRPLLHRLLYLLPQLFQDYEQLLHLLTMLLFRLL